MASLANLPPELICKILENLPVDELIGKSSVCKRWNELISSSIKVKRLTVDHCACTSCRFKWRNSSRPIDLREEFCHENLFALLLHRPILSKLKYFAAETGDELKNFHPNDLNAFGELVHLEIDYWAEDPIASVEWRLPKLETLRFVFSRGRNSFKFQLTVDCPKLKTLAGSFPDENALDIKWPETIRTLDFRFKEIELTKFKNVEVYRLGTELLKDVDDALLRQLPNLTTLELDGAIDGFDFKINEIKPLLKQLLNYKRKAMQPNLRLWYAGINLEDEQSVDEIDLRLNEYERPNTRSLKMTSNEHLYMPYLKNKPTHLRDKLGFVWSVNYNYLMSLVCEIPGDYFRRFSNIRLVCANGEIQDPAHFRSFLKRVEFLFSLYLSYPGLQQTWYDQLPEFCSLSEFELFEKEELELNFDFLGRFDLERGFALNKDLVLSSMQSLRVLHQASWSADFKAKFRGKNVQIQKRQIKNKKLPRDQRISEVYDVLVEGELKLNGASSMEALNYFDEDDA